MDDFVQNPLADDTSHQDKTMQRIFIASVCFYPIIDAICSETDPSSSNTNGVIMTGFSACYPQSAHSCLRTIQDEFCC